jgi:glycosyltransferase involved in cell wall biosynthesis
MSISVVIPCYNAAPFLRQALDSVFGQTLQPVDVVLVDDGSTDDSVAIAEAAGYPVQIIRQPNQGPSIARNVGTAATRGEYLAYLDADDLWAPRSLEALAAAVEGRPNRVGLMSCAVFEDDPSRPTAVYDRPYAGFFPHIIEANLRNPICFLTSRAHFERVGGFTRGTRIFEDWDFWAQIALLGAELVCVPYVGGLYRRHPAATLKTVQAKKRALGHMHVVERLAAGMFARPELLDQWGEQLFWSSWTALRRGQECGASGAEIKSLAAVLKTLATQGPAKLRKTRSAKMVRFLGYRWAERLREVLSPVEAKGPAAVPAGGVK